jgi:hypothetical protein
MENDKRTILVIDDDPSILLGLSATIRRHGFQVVTATNGTEGLEKAREVVPDLILSDVMMPPPDGGPGMMPPGMGPDEMGQMGGEMPPPGGGLWGPPPQGPGGYPADPQELIYRIQWLENELGFAHNQLSQVPPPEVFQQQIARIQELEMVNAELRASLEATEQERNDLRGSVEQRLSNVM